MGWLSRVDSYQDAPREAIVQRFLDFARHTQLAALLSEYAAQVRRPLYRISMEHHNSDNPLLILITYEPGRTSERVLAECEGHGEWLAWREG